MRLAGKVAVIIGAGQSPGEGSATLSRALTPYWMSVKPSARSRSRTRR